MKWICDSNLGLALLLDMHKYKCHSCCATVYPVYVVCLLDLLPFACIKDKCEYFPFLGIVFMSETFNISRIIIAAVAPTSPPLLLLRLLVYFLLSLLGRPVIAKDTIDM